jgi:hypothetical protein
MPDTTVPFEIVIFTREHSITGGVFLREQRLSDFMNDARDTSTMLRNSTVAKLENPAKIIEKTMISFVPKAGIMLVFEPPQKGPPLPQRFIKYPKEQYPIFIINDSMEIRGIIHMHGALDLVHLLTNEAQTPFVPITHATVALDANPDFKLKDVTVLVNANHIRFIGEVQPKSKTQPRP